MPPVKLTASSAFGADCVGDEPLGRLGGLGRGDHPADDVPAVDVEHHMQYSF
jgi:hypothetical protein